MTEAFRSAVEFRHDLCATVAQLQQRFTRPLPDGATVFVTGTSGLYRLFKGLGDAFDLLTTVIVIPGDQSDNRWVLEEVDGSSPWAGVEVLTSTATVSVEGSDTWAILGSTAATFELASGITAMFSVNPTSGLLTYHGPDRDMLVTATVSARTPAADNIHAVISRDGDVADGSSANEYVKGEQAGNTAGETEEVDLLANVTVQRMLTLTEGDTLRLMLRNDRGQPMTVEFFTLSVQPK